MKIYSYSVSYHPKKDDFYGLVEDLADDTIIYEIQSSKDMVDLIQHKVMIHVDDLIGLRAFLLHEGVMKREDKIILGDVWI